MDEKIKRGKILLISITCITLIMGVLSFLVIYKTKGILRIEDFARLFLTTILCIFLYKGHKWARYTLGIFSLIAALLILFVIIKLIQTIPIIAILLLGIFLIIYIFLFINLIFSKSITIFMNSKIDK